MLEFSGKLIKILINLILNKYENMAAEHNLPESQRRIIAGVETFRLCPPGDAADKQVQSILQLVAEHLKNGGKLDFTVNLSSRPILVEDWVAKFSQREALATILFLDNGKVGQVALHAAVIAKDFFAVLAILRARNAQGQGINVNARDSSGKTALDMAARLGGHLGSAIADLLINHGAEKTAPVSSYLSQSRRLRKPFSDPDLSIHL